MLEYLSGHGMRRLGPLTAWSPVPCSVGQPVGLSASPPRFPHIKHQASCNAHCYSLPFLRH